MCSYVLEMQNITKKFGEFKANDDISLKLKKGEIHALLGENGAGKSTLMSVLFGLYTAECGNIFINDKKVLIKNPNDANDLGIGMVHQHFKLVHNFTVLESIVLGVEATKSGVLSFDAAKKKILDLCDKYKFKLDINAKIADITVGAQQKVEILKMLYRDNDILIFDEPTAVLTPQEITELLKIMKTLTNEGKSIIFITHKLKEIKAVADNCTVLRKGKCIGTVLVNDTSEEELAKMMVGREIVFNVDKAPKKLGDTALEVKNLTIMNKNSEKPIVNNVSFELKKGEILCVAGIDGNGQSELVYGITGLLPIKSGQILLNGDDITYKSVRKKSLAGLSHIPEDRHKDGLVLDFTLAENLVLQTYFKYQKNSFIKFKEVSKFANRLIEKFDIRSANGEKSIVRSMSGGNQQKAIIARELDKDPEVIIAVQPVRGLDVGAIEYIHSQLIKKRDEGKAILLVSLELSEVLSLSDRILVMYEGEIVADVIDTTAEELGLYMSGSKRGALYEK